MGEYHDRELYDKNISSFNTLPFIQLRSSNLQNYILPIVGNSKEISKRWKFPLGMVLLMEDIAEKLHLMTMKVGILTF